MVSQGRYRYSFNEGNKAEDKFKQLMLSRGNTCVKSSRSDDMQKHIDFYVNDIPIDVKGNRHLDTIWLELKNVKGDKGWLECCSDYIVFDVVELNSFCFFDRNDLLLYASRFKEIAKDKTEYKKRYTRKNRLDVLIKVRYNDIKHLQKQIIEYNNEQEDRQP